MGRSPRTERLWRAFAVKFGRLHLFENPIGRTENEKVIRSMELMRDKVMPQVRHLGQDTATGIGS